MLKFKRITEIRSDETAGYQVFLNKNYTVQELLNEINDGENWGCLQVINGSSCEYRHGELLSNLSDFDLDKKVKKVIASGGWSNMNYYVEVF